MVSGGGKWGKGPNRESWEKILGRKREKISGKEKALGRKERKGSQQGKGGQDLRAEKGEDLGKALGGRGRKEFNKERGKKVFVRKTEKEKRP